MYEAEIYENATVGTFIARVHATDADAGAFGEVRYGVVSSPDSDSLWVDPTTGVVSVSSNNHGFDREALSEHRFHIEAKDGGGRSVLVNSASTTLVIRLLDVNDNPPAFRRPSYEGIMAPDLTRLRTALVVEATDADAPGPNSEIRYRIWENYDGKFAIDARTGEITVRSQLHSAAAGGGERPVLQRPERQTGYRREDVDTSMMAPIIKLTVRAHDLGIPQMYTDCPVYIHTNEVSWRTMRFIVPHPTSWVRANRQKVEETLSTLTGGAAIFKDSVPYTGREHGKDLSGGTAYRGEKSVVTATITFPVDSVVDVERVRDRLEGNSSYVAMEAVEVYRGENRVLLGVLIFLVLLFIIVLITLLLCCLCPWGYCYRDVSGGKTARVGSSDSSVRPLKVKLLEEEEGGGGGGPRRRKERLVEVLRTVRTPDGSTRKEAWSADPRRERRQVNINNNYWRFRSANDQQEDSHSADDTRRAVIVNNNEVEVDGRRIGPNVIYSRQLQSQLANQQDGGVLYVEDYEDNNVRGERVRRNDSRTLRRAESMVVLQRADRDIDRDVYVVRDGDQRDYRGSLRLRGERQLVPPRRHRSQLVLVRKNEDDMWEDVEADSMRRHEMERGSDPGYTHQARNPDVMLAQRYVLDDDTRSLPPHHHRSSSRVRPFRPPDGSERDIEMVVTLDAESGRTQRYIRDGDTEILRLETRGGTIGPPQTQEGGDSSSPSPSHRPLKGDDGKDIIMRRFMEDQDRRQLQAAAAGPSGFVNSALNYLQETNKMPGQQPSQVDIRVTEPTPQNSVVSASQETLHQAAVHTADSESKSQSQSQVEWKQTRKTRHSMVRSPLMTESEEERRGGKPVDLSESGESTSGEPPNSNKDASSQQQQPPPPPQQQPSSIVRPTANRPIRTPIMEEAEDVDSSEIAKSSVAVDPTTTTASESKQTAAAPTTVTTAANTSYGETKASILRKGNSSGKLENPRVVAIKQEETETKQDLQDRLDDDDEERRRNSFDSAELNAAGNKTSSEDRGRHKKKKDGKTKHRHRRSSVPASRERTKKHEKAEDDEDEGHKKKHKRHHRKRSYSPHRRSASSDEEKRHRRRRASSEPKSLSKKKREHSKSHGEPDPTYKKPVEAPRYMNWYKQDNHQQPPQSAPAPNRASLEDDLDSGIALSQQHSRALRGRAMNQRMEKKSIFTIAYDDMQTKQIGRSDTLTPPY